MKINKFKSKQILKLHLLNSKAYEYISKKANPGILTSFNVTQIVADFKKVLHVIFQYHQADKRILFIGIPKKLELKINQLTNHVAVSSNFELQGVISNNLKMLKIGKSNKQSFSKVYSKLLLPKLTKKPDLVVLFSHEKKQNIINESHIAKVPLILFDYNDDLKGAWSNSLYNLQGIGDSLARTSNKNLFFFGLNFLFKTVKRKSNNNNQKFKKFNSKSANSHYQTSKRRFK